VRIQPSHIEDRRIEDIWGERTPMGPGEPWPSRVDTYLQPGVGAADVDRWVHSACVLCSNGCGLEIAVKDDRMVGVRGQGHDRVNAGRLGPKGLFGWQGQQRDRLLRPMIRRGGELREADWDEAMDAIVRRSRELLDDKGPLTHAFYTSGQLMLEEYYTLAVIGKAGIGTPHMDGNTRLCTATAAQSLKESFGTDGQTGSYTWTTVTRSSTSATTSPRPRRCCGPGCSTASQGRIRPSTSRSTPA
jgi:anaerobic selenocysteine-containing dehydrogenase